MFKRWRSRVKIYGCQEGKHNTPEGNRLDVLVTLVEAWEARHYPLDLPDPVEAIRRSTSSRSTADCAS